LIESRRLIDQRLRNRVIEALLGLAEWEAEARAGDLDGLFNDAFDNLEPTHLAVVETLSAAERDILKCVWAALERASAVDDASRGSHDAAASLAFVGDLAREGLAVFKARGRFSEIEEEDQPSAGWWPYPHAL
jgi:hypothetical protein